MTKEELMDAIILFAYYIDDRHVLDGYTHDDVYYALGGLMELCRCME